MQGGDKLNKDIKSWSMTTRADLVTQFSKLNIQHVERSPSLRPSRDVLASRTSMRQGMINRVSFSFPRHMVFVHKGVGKGVPISKVGTSNRKAKEWFNPVVDRDIEKLADIVADGQGDLIVNNLSIK